MNIKTLTTSSLLLALGLLLHTITPPLLGGVKPDFLLASMFLAIALSPKASHTLAIGLAAGILAAMTTGFPGGQIPSILDKLVSAYFVYGLFTLYKTSNNLIFSLITFLGTLISGLVFLLSAFVLVGLPVSFGSLVLVVVLPTACANAIVNLLLHKSLHVMVKI